MDARLAAEQTPWLARVFGPNGLPRGAAFLVDDRVLLTCAHVVGDALGSLKAAEESEPPTAEISLDFPTVAPTPVSARVRTDGWFPLLNDGSGDMAVLELTGDPPPGTQRAPLRGPPSVWDHPFRVKGFPTGADGGVWSSGRFLGPSLQEWVQIEDVKTEGISVEPGFSGAPVWDESLATVVGMVVAQDRREAAKTAYMMPLRLLARMWTGLDELIPSRLLADPELRAHWGPRARGVRRDANRGWYFTGRTAVLRELVGWLAGSERKGGVSVVTGGPGSGKSAVLARLVTLSDAQYRKQVPLDDAPEGTVPPPGTVDVAVHVRGKTMKDVVAAIADAAEVTAGSHDELIDALFAREDPFTVVLDALDEASGEGEGRRIAADFLQPLANEAPSSSCVRVLVGTRRTLVRALGASASVIDLDESPYLEPADLAAYVRRCLLIQGDPAAQSPYRAIPEQHLGEIAEAVAARVKQAFLVAQIVARSMTLQEHTVDIGQAGWEEFPATVGNAMDEYLARFGPEEQRLRELLAPLAYAEGSGLPGGDLWARLATALSHTTYDGADVAWLLAGSASDLLEQREDISGSLVTYRLFHRALGEHLRLGQPIAALQSTITSALVESVPAGAGGVRDWSAASPYVRKHMATHAAAAGRLDALVEDPAYLLSAEPARLLPVLSAATSPRAREAAGVYERTAHQLGSATAWERASYLEMTARQAGASALADQMGHLVPSRPWSVPWARWRRAPRGLVIRRQSAPVWAVAAGRLGRRPVVAWGAQDGTLGVQGLEEGGSGGAAIADHGGGIHAVALAVVKGRDVVISGSEDPNVRVWDIADKTMVAEYPHGDGARVWALAVGHAGGRPILATGSLDGLVRVWDLEAGTPLGAPLVGNGGQIRAVAFVELDGRPVLVSGGQDGLVRIWDPLAGRLLGDPLPGHAGEIWALDAGVIGGRPAAVSGGADGAVRAWDLEKRQPWGMALGEHDDEVYAVALGQMAGRTVVASAGRDGMVRIWDPEQGQAIGGTLTRDSDVVYAMATTHFKDRSFVVAACLDGTVRAWELTSTLGPSEGAEDQYGEVHAIALADVGQRSVGVSGGADGSLWPFDAGTGEPCDDPVQNHGAGVWSVGLANLAGRPVVVSGGVDGRVRIGDLGDGTVLFESPDHEGDVFAVAIGDLEGRQVLASGGQDRTVRLRDLAGPASPAKTWAHNDGVVYALALDRLGERPVIFAVNDELIHISDLLDAGSPPGVLADHEGPVYALAVGSLDGRKLLASGGRDWVVRIWDPAALGAPTAKLVGHSDQVYALAMGALAGRERIISGGADGTIRVWTHEGVLEHTINTGAPVFAVKLLEEPPGVLVGTGSGRMLIRFEPPA